MLQRYVDAVFLHPGLATRVPRLGYLIACPAVPIVVNALTPIVLVAQS